jgi:hypothetical protein
VQDLLGEVVYSKIFLIRWRVGMSAEENSVEVANNNINDDYLVHMKDIGDIEFKK